MPTPARAEMKITRLRVKTTRRSILRGFPAPAVFLLRVRVHARGRVNEPHGRMFSLPRIGAYPHACQGIPCGQLPCRAPRRKTPRRSTAQGFLRVRMYACYLSISARWAPTRVFTILRARLRPYARQRTLRACFSLPRLRGCTRPRQ